MSRTVSWSLTAAHGQRKYLSPDERGRFLAAAEAAPAGVRTFCLVLAWSGCRLSEALALTRADVQAEAGCLLVRSLKKRGRELVGEIPLPPELVQRLVREHAGQAPAERLWPWPRTRVRFACSGLDRGWKLKAEFLSQRYTTRWAELLHV